MAFQVVSRPTGRRFVFAAPLMLAAAGARAQPEDVQFKRSSLTIVAGGHALEFEVDLATNDAERSRGLMFRKQLGAYEGMLFDFFKEMPVSFWMKNTLIPLDMVFIAADGKVHRIEPNTEPFSTELISSEGPVVGVLELNGGAAARIGLKRGDTVIYPGLGK
jgi:uncharacterized membrane protein (UPF0127 family)